MTSDGMPFSSAYSNWIGVLPLNRSFTVWISRCRLSDGAASSSEITSSNSDRTT